MKNENGQEKSAILKGQTLVNLCNVKNNATFQSAYNGNTPNRLTQFMSLKNTVLQPNTKYLVRFRITNYVNESNLTIMLTSSDYHISSKSIIINGNGYYNIIVTTSSDMTNYGGMLIVKGDATVFESNTTSNVSFMISGKMVIKYQEGMENCDIPYFEGMQSVKMPVLTTIGKNLIPNDGFSDSTFTKSENGININKQTEGAWIYMFEDCLSIPLKKGNYFYSSQLVTGEYLGGATQFIFSDGTYSKELINDNVGRQLIWTLDLETDKVLTGIRVWNAKGNCTMQFQLVEGTQETSYEPYKTNILTVNEEVELRGVGDVADELDCKNGVLTKNCDAISITSYLTNSQPWGTTTMRFSNSSVGLGNDILADNLPIIDTNLDKEVEGCCMENGTLRFVLKGTTHDEAKARAQELATTFIVASRTPQTQQIATSLTDQNNQPQERMKLFPSGYINTSSSTIPPILELKGIVHNNKLNMTTTNGVYTNNIQSLTNPVLDGIVCQNGTVVRDSYDVESGLYTKRVFRATIDEQFINNYTWNITLPSNYQVVQFSRLNPLPKPYNVSSVIGNNIITAYAPDFTSVELATNNNIYIRIGKEELISYDVDGLLDWIKRNGAIEVAYEMAIPQIIHMQPNMQPYAIS